MEIKEDKKIVFCIPERESSHENGQGLLKPVFEETIDGLEYICFVDSFACPKWLHVWKW